MVGALAYAYGESLTLQRLAYVSFVAVISLLGWLAIALPSYLLACCRHRKNSRRCCRRSASNSAAVALAKKRPRKVGRDATITLVVLPSAAVGRSTAHRHFSSVGIWTEARNLFRRVDKDRSHSIERDEVSRGTSAAYTTTLYSVFAIDGGPAPCAIMAALHLARCHTFVPQCALLPHVFCILRARTAPGARANQGAAFTCG